MIKLKVQRETDRDYQKKVISSIDNKIANLQETRTLGVAVRSVGSSNSGTIVVLILSGIVGLMLAFLAEFVSIARQRMTVQNG